MSIPRKSSAHDLLKKTCKHISNNWRYSKAEVSKLMIELNLDNDEHTSSNDVERANCAANICESIQNIRKKLDRIYSSVRYSDHTVNVAMSLFLQSKKGLGLVDQNSLAYKIKKVTNL